MQIDIDEAAGARDDTDTEDIGVDTKDIDVWEEAE